MITHASVTTKINQVLSIREKVIIIKKITLLESKVFHIFFELLALVL